MSAAGTAYLREHGIDLDFARQVGVEVGDVDSERIAYTYRRPDGSTYARQRHLTGKYAGKTMQPSGEPLSLYWPLGRKGGAAIFLCEGEPDALSAGQRLRGEELPAPLDGLTVAAVPGATFPADRAAKELRDAGAEVVYTAFDGDDAGRQAAARIGESLREVGIEVLNIALPDGQDIADVLAAADDSTAALAELVAEAEAAVEVSIEGDIAGEEAAEIEPLPNDAVGGLLEQVADTLERYVVLPGEQERDVLALFAAHTWAADGAHATPYVLVVSPEKRSGKSRLLQVLELVVARPWGVIGASEAAMFRKIAKDKPTLLLDEIDAIFGSNSERTEPLRAILNAGNRPGATVARCVGENKDVEDFPIFCAKVLAGIDSGHRIPDTIRDRAVTISMQRKTGAEPVARFRYRDANAEAQPIRDSFQRWAVGAVDLLLAANPDLPHELDDRAAEAWEPLFAIADIAGGEWPQRARVAAKALSGEVDRDEVTTGTMLLGAIREAFGDADRLTSANLLGAINADEQLPFGGWRDGKGIDGRGVARLLKPYGVKPRPINLGGEKRAKGYLRKQFEEPWERWLPTPDFSVTTVTTVTDPDLVTENSASASQSNRVTDVTAISDGNGAVAATEAEEAEIARVAAKLGSAA